MKLAPVVLALVVLAPSVSASWDTYRGQADRNGVAQLPSGPLDVTVTRTLAVGMQAFWGAQALPTKHGLLELQTNGRQCALVLIETPTSAPRNLTALPRCDFTVLTSYDETTDLAIVCMIGTFTQPVLQARNVDDGTMRWGVSPQVLGFSDGEGLYACGSSAIDPATGRIVTVIADQPQGNQVGSRVVSVERGDGKLAWTTPIPAQTPSVPGGLVGNPTGSAPEQLAPARAWGVSLTAGGIVVTGYYGNCGTAYGATSIVTSNAGTVNPTCALEGFAAWLDPRGNFRDIEPARTKASGAPSTAGGRAVSQYAVSAGPIAGMAIGDEVILINPSASGTVGRAPLHAFEPVSTNVLWPTGAWTKNVLIVGLPHSLSAFSAVNLQPAWSWTRGQSWEVVDTMLDASGTLNVLTIVPRSNATVLVRVDAATGATLSTLPLPIPVPLDYYAHLVPVPGWGLAVVDNYGDLVVLGTADPSLAPKLSISDAFPAPGEAMRITPGGNASSFVFNWGDGTEENVTSPRAVNHTFPTYGPRDVRVTAIFPDGRTATTVATIDVGGTPPPRLNAIQSAFAPENQNLTFGILGILITIFGAIFTIGRTRRRIARLERELSAVEEIRVLSTRDPREAARVLRDYRDNLPGELKRRRIDDSQYAVLDTHSSRLLRVLKTRLFTPYDARFSPEFRRLLDAAFDDAVLQPSERDALVHALRGEERMTPAERTQIQDILGDFTSARDALGKPLA